MKKIIDVLMFFLHVFIIISLLLITYGVFTGLNNVFEYLGIVLFIFFFIYLILTAHFEIYKILLIYKLIFIVYVINIVFIKEVSLDIYKKLDKTFIQNELLDNKINGYEAYNILNRIEAHKEKEKELQDKKNEELKKEWEKEKEVETKLKIEIEKERLK